MLPGIAYLLIFRRMGRPNIYHRRRWIAGLLGAIEHPVQGLGHAGEVQLGEQRVERRAHQSPSGSWKKAPRTCLRISDSRRVRS